MLRQRSEDHRQPVECLHQDEIAAFRHQVKQVRDEDALGWEATRKFITRRRLPATQAELAEHIRKVSLAGPVRQMLLRALGVTDTDHSSLQTELLKQLTGFPTSKAIRALCLYFQIGHNYRKNGQDQTPPEIEAFLGTNPNPYDLLLQSENPTVLDLGAGDLTFEEELIDRYVPELTAHHRALVVHAIDRLQPGSQFGGVYHASQERLRKFSTYSSDALQFRFWGGIDMAESLTLRGLLPAYTIVTCHAPATPTFAYEPRRISPDVITPHLERTKGVFRTIRVHGEEALEVSHRGKALTFPAWKFAIQGPLILLELMARRGRLCVISAIDTEVFWEILAQLVETDSFRPTNVIFTKDNIPEVFAPIYDSLSALNNGDRLQLGDLTSLRSLFPYHLPLKPRGSSGYRFHSIEIRRGATFHGMPASFTARQFSHMREETPPWCMILTPELLPEHLTDQVSGDRPPDVRPV